MAELKGSIPSGHMPKNRYELWITGVPPYPGGVLIATSVKGLEREIESVELPDRTYASGGQVKPGMLTITIPLHDTVAQGYMYLWAKQSEAPVDPNYKKAITIIFKGIHFGSLLGGDLNARSIGVVGAWAKKLTIDDLDMKDEGNMTETAWQICYDDITAL